MITTLFVSGEPGQAPTAQTFAQNRLIVLTLAYCGIRWGEMAALKVSSVDFLRRRLSVVASVSDVDGEGLVWTTPKDHENRSVPIPAFLADELAAHVGSKSRDDLLFASHTGGPLSHRLERRAWFNRAAESVGVADLTPHDLRHTAASLAVSAGANVKAVQRMLGHAQASMTLDTYADLFDSDLDAVAERLDAVARAVSEPQTELSRNLAPVSALPANA